MSTDDAEKLHLPITDYMYASINEAKKRIEEGHSDDGSILTATFDALLGAIEDLETSLSHAGIKTAGPSEIHGKKEILDPPGTPA